MQRKKKVLKLKRYSYHTIEKIGENRNIKRHPLYTIPPTQTLELMVLSLQKLAIILLEHEFESTPHQ